MKKKTNPGLKIICFNRKASFNYFFENLIEAGIVLKGSEIKSIVAKREEIARKEMKPHYKKILADAEAAGAVMDEEAVRNIYTFVKENNLQDLFGDNAAVFFFLSILNRPAPLPMSQVSQN